MNEVPIHNGRVNLSSVAGAAVYADTLPIPTADLNGRKGWLYTKTAGAEKLNYFFYAQGAHPVTLSQIENIFFVGIINNWTDARNVPFIVIYTKPKFDGQDGGAWYRTKRTFSIHADAQITLGMRTQFSIRQFPTPSFPFAHVSLPQITTVGPNSQDEEILTIAIHTDSGSANNISVLVSHVGWKQKNINANPNILLSGN